MCTRFYSQRHLILFSLLLLLSFAACSEENTAAATDEDHSDFALEVVELTPESIRKADLRIVKSEQIELQEWVETTGIVSPNESRVAHIRPLSQGVIHKVYVRRGDRVQEGQPLVQYDNIELGELIGEYLSQLARLRKDLAQQEVAQKFWERGLQLLEEQAITEKEVELREAQHKDAQAMVDSRRAELAKAEEKLHRFGLSEEDIDELKKAGQSGRHRTASQNTLRAPFSGVIIGYDVAEGELVGPSRELLTLADIRTVWVLADVYEKDLALISEGHPVEVSSASYPGRVFEGHLTYISDVLERETRTARVRCVVPNSDRALKLEMFVMVRTPSTHRIVAVAVPASAIQTIAGQETIFIAEGPGTFRKRIVQTGLSADDWIAVQGLEEGVPVVAEGSFYVKSAFQRETIGGEH